MSKTEFLRDHQTNTFNKTFVDVLRKEGLGDPCVDAWLYEIIVGSSIRIPILFQHGPIVETGVNGVTNEAVLAIVLDRLRCFQRGAYSCRENAIAITKIEEALHWLGARSRALLDRERRLVEGEREK